MCACVCIRAQGSRIRESEFFKLDQLLGTTVFFSRNVYNGKNNLHKISAKVELVLCLYFCFYISYIVPNLEYNAFSLS